MSAVCTHVSHVKHSLLWMKTEKGSLIVLMLCVEVVTPSEKLLSLLKIK